MRSPIFGFAGGFPQALKDKFLAKFGNGVFDTAESIHRAAAAFRRERDIPERAKAAEAEVRKLSAPEPALAPASLDPVAEAIVKKHTEGSSEKAVAKIASADLWSRTVDQINKLVARAL